jgi:hypothetical protein
LLEPKPFHLRRDERRQTHRDVFRQWFWYVASGQQVSGDLDNEAAISRVRDGRLNVLPAATRRGFAVRTTVSNCSSPEFVNEPKKRPPKTLVSHRVAIAHLRSSQPCENDSSVVRAGINRSSTHRQENL